MNNNDKGILKIWILLISLYTLCISIGLIVFHIHLYDVLLDISIQQNINYSYLKEYVPKPDKEPVIETSLEEEEMISPDISEEMISEYQSPDVVEDLMLSLNDYKNDPEYGVPSGGFNPPDDAIIITTDVGDEWYHVTDDWVFRAQGHTAIEKVNELRDNYAYDGDKNKYPRPVWEVDGEEIIPIEMASVSYANVMYWFMWTSESGREVILNEDGYPYAFKE